MHHGEDIHVTVLPFPLDGHSDFLLDLRSIEKIFEAGEVVSVVESDVIDIFHCGVDVEGIGLAAR